MIRFLNDLNGCFAHSKSQIMTMNPLPDIDKAFSLVIQKKCYLNSSISIEYIESTVDALDVNVQSYLHGKGTAFNKGK